MGLAGLLGARLACPVADVPVPPSEECGHGHNNQACNDEESGFLQEHHIGTLVEGAAE